MKKFLLTSLLFGSSTMVAAAPFVVKNIQIDGANPSTEQLILSQLPVKVGQRVGDQTLANLVRTLYTQGDFSDVQAKQQGNTLVIQVVEKPKIATFEITGNKAVPTDALKQNLAANGLTDGNILNKEKLNAFIDELKKHYATIGRYNATVDVIYTPAANNGVNIKLEIKEGNEALVKSVIFEGNKVFSDSKLLEQLEIHPDVSLFNFFASSRFSQQKLQNDITQLRDFYLNKGYAQFRLDDVQTKLSDNKENLTLIYKIYEGEKYNVASVRIVGNTAGLASKLQPLLDKIAIGKTFRGSDVTDVENNIKSILGNAGYASPQVTVSPTFDPAKQTMNITFVVDAGERYYVDKIIFEGNSSTHDSTLRQQMRQQEGSWYSANAVDLGKLRLERTGFFESVSSSTKLVPGTKDQIDIIYNVKERNTGSINFGVGYGTESGFSYNASIRQDNFLGKGSSISLGGTRNDYGTSINLGYNEPYFTQDGISLGGNVSYSTYDNSKNKNSASYSQTSYGVGTTLGFPVNENNSYSTGLSYNYNKLSNIDPEYRRALYLDSLGAKQWSYTTKDLNLSFGWNYNSLNRGFFPTQGTTANIGGGVTLPVSTNRYYTLNFNTQSFYPLNRDQTWVLTGRASFNFANGFGGKKLPFNQYFSAGGIGTIRGFSYGSIGPKALYLPNNADNNCKVGVNPNPACYTSLSNQVVGGNAMATASVELIFPTPLVSDRHQINVRTSVFVDAASVWDTHWKKTPKPAIENLPDFGNAKRFRASAGIALQWQSPIGPLVFSYAKPVRKYANDDVEQFQFNIGGTF
ncbi:outer membrane protein assembly factor BamA [Mergibacter septicus]|uniref:Outer membrane protein assembly factor BamA n=1 Tax=Mergibacter septicus TaxID=221402 RepID=A0A8E3S8S8_9PAST|nr:outer membrane protein assembly factor BamA [Mergibacter septicus]AWX15840.1 outer membrane protein assembly factor BamA [Mergibacter septicus]QDJ15093.1 outer membrane protein assembly factor BamA [Mergibacter septicus]UTU47483.1 outer membrane protein assembly factor BamA [Mergibacter septicus]WMR95336.1 outer membrane protein assembly factor BamA [Mergibacter septicus]